MAIGDYSNIIMAGKRNNIAGLERLGEGLAAMGSAFAQGSANRKIRDELDRRHGDAIVTDYSEPVKADPSVHAASLMMGFSPAGAGKAATGTKSISGRELAAQEGIDLGKDNIPATDSKKQVREQLPGEEPDWDRIERIARQAEARGLKPMYSSQELENRRTARERMEMEWLSKNRDKLLQAASQFNTRANGIRSSIGAMIAKGELSTEDKEFIKQQKADLKSQLKAYEKIRAKAIKEGVDPDFFAEFTELEGGADSYIPTEILEELYMKAGFGDKLLGLPEVKAKVKAASPNYDFGMFTDGDWKKIQGYQHDAVNLARGNIISENEVIRSGQSVTQGRQDIESNKWSLLVQKAEAENKKRQALGADEFNKTAYEALSRHEGKYISDADFIALTPYLETKKSDGTVVPFDASFKGISGWTYDKITGMGAKKRKAAVSGALAKLRSEGYGQSSEATRDNEF
jgi:hypothetical protein